ncbi:hypothetical protein [Streptomyces sp. NPDC060366]|uniref:hypothetical protein n=1 Tax=Streptomyces sp. NPDC060366 TaxID=3347105 RepID=UPI0036467E57
MHEAVSARIVAGANKSAGTDAVRSVRNEEFMDNRCSPVNSRVGTLGRSGDMAT